MMITTTFHPIAPRPEMESIGNSSNNTSILDDAARALLLVKQSPPSRPLPSSSQSQQQQQPQQQQQQQKQQQTMFVTPNSSSSNLSAHYSLALLSQQKQDQEKLFHKQQASLQRQIEAAQQQQQMHSQSQEEQRTQDNQELSPRPFKKRKMMIPSVSLPNHSTASGIPQDTTATATATPRRPQSSAIVQAIAALTRHSSQEDLTRKTKALAAKLRSKNASSKMMIPPSRYAQSVFLKNGGGPGRGQAVLSAARTDYTFHQPTAVDMEIHTNHWSELHGYIRRGTDADATGFKECVRRLQQHYFPPSSSSSSEAQPQQQVFRCCNRFGESLLHLACRRGRTEMVRFLLEDLSSPASTTTIRTVSPVSHDESSSSADTTDQQCKDDYARSMLAVRDDYNKTPFHDACWTASPNYELIDLLLQYAPVQILMEDIRGNTPFDYVRKDDYPLWLKFLYQRKSLLHC